MENLIQEAKGVSDGFFALTDAVRQRSVFSAKENEMVLIGIFTASGAMRGLVTHVKKAIGNAIFNMVVTSDKTLVISTPNHVSLLHVTIENNEAKRLQQFLNLLPPAALGPLCIITSFN